METITLHKICDEPNSYQEDNEPTNEEIEKMAEMYYETQAEISRGK